MKKQYLILIIILVLGLLALIVANNKSSEESLEDFQEKVVQNSLGQMCFLYEQEAPVELAGDIPDAFNREYIELLIAEDGNTTGIHNIIPFGTDSNFATFFGVSDETFVNVVATATAEGDTWQEHRLYKIQNDKLLVGYQPVYVPRYQNEHGVYMYEDINKIEFATNEFFLSKVDCESVDKTTVL